MDTVLEKLVLQAQQAANSQDADVLNTAKSIVKKCVFGMLQLVKDTSASGKPASAEAEADMAEKCGTLKRTLLKVRSVIAADSGGGLTVDSPASQRFKKLQEQAAAAKSKASALAPAPAAASSTPVAASPVVPSRFVAARPSSESEGPQKSPRKMLMGQHMKQNRNSVNLSSTLEGMAPQKTELLLRQMDSKCRWLEDELYRSTEVRVILHLVQAQNLSPVDPNGLSDPYCIVPSLKSSQGGQVQTKVCHENLDPVWEESFEVELPSRSWSFRIELMDYDDPVTSKPLGYVDLRADDWKLSTRREQKMWIPVQDGNGRIYVGLKAAAHLGLNRVTGPQYMCNCCGHDEIPDMWPCEVCQKPTCALCLAIFRCDTCREDICKRRKVLDDQARVEEEEAISVAAPLQIEVAAAERNATELTPEEWVSAKHYTWPVWKSSELGETPHPGAPVLISVPKSYLVEYGSPKNPPLDQCSLEMLDPMESYPHYTNHLIKTDHGIFVGTVPSSSTPLVVVVQKLAYNARDEQTLLALVLAPDGTTRERLVVDCADLRESSAGGASGMKKSLAASKGPAQNLAASKGHSSRSLLTATSGLDLRSLLLSSYSGVVLQRVPSSFHAEVSAKLLEYERNHLDQRRRVGVLYFPAGVREENAVFKSTGSPDLYEFMDLLAERVRLEGWSKYAGGLNTKNNSTGNESYYTEFLGFSIMFHVNSLLEDDGSEQQLARKRYIGNDLVVFIFLEGDEPFDPLMITSQMCHTFIVVRKVGSKPTRYSVAVVAKPSVPAFTPLVPPAKEFEKSEKLREFLLAKALNGNRATFQAKTFQQKTKRTRRDLLARIIKDLNDEGVLSGSPEIIFNPEQEPSPIALCADNVQLRAIADFIAEDATFLSLRTGDIVTAVTANPSDVHWTGILNGHVGRFPRDMVELASKRRHAMPGMLRKENTLNKNLTGQTIGTVLFRLRIIQGRNMSVCDPWGTSDPYCTVSGVLGLDGKQIRTKVHSRTLNPQWNQGFEFHNTDPFTIRVEVWDKDLVGTDDSMGFVDILSKDWNLSETNHEEIRWLPVIDGDGELQLSLTRLFDQSKRR